MLRRQANRPIKVWPGRGRKYRQSSAVSLYNVSRLHWMQGILLLLYYADSDELGNQSREALVSRWRLRWLIAALKLTRTACTPMHGTRTRKPQPTPADPVSNRATLTFDLLTPLNPSHIMMPSGVPHLLLSRLSDRARRHIRWQTENKCI